MKRNAKIFLLAAILSTTFAGIFAAGELAFADGDDDKDNVVPLKESKLIIEHNDREKDTGFQLFLDSEGWNTMTVTGPDGKVIDFKAKGELGQLGLTELFFETVEPENSEVPLDELLQTLPEGEYTFKGSAIAVGEKNGTTTGTDMLTHVIPRGPEILAPVENSTVSPDADLLVDWNAVDETIDGKPVNIIAYQVIVEKDEPPEPQLISPVAFNVVVGPDVTEMRVPSEFLEPGTDYVFEVLAIEESGNQSLFDSRFSTSD